MSRFPQVWTLLTVFLFAYWPLGAAAQEQTDDPDQVEIYLHTVNVGNMIYDNFGHTALRVVDKNRGRDLVYNWGIFEFDNPAVFGFNFYRGNLFYKLGAYSYRGALASYQRDGRQVWEDRLNLTREEKKILLDRLAWNLEPENVHYAYQYFFDNCATRPRDYIDEALGGALKRATTNVLSSRSFRDFVRDGYSPNPGMDVMLDFGMNSNLDRFASNWETMFHPLHLRSQLLAYEGPDGPLLTEGKVLVQAPGPNSYPDFAYSMLLLVGGVPVALLGILLFIQQKRTEPARWLYRGLGFFGSFWFFWGGFFGFLMFISWIFSGHVDLHHNANLLLFWPVDLFLFVLAFRLMWNGRPLQLTVSRKRAVDAFLLLHMISILILATLRLFGQITQDVDRVLIYLLPPYTALLLLFYRCGFRRKES